MTTCQHETIYAQIVSVSRSGMTRRLRFYAVRGGEIQDITKEIAGKTGCNLDKDWNLVVRGCGMDMIFSVLYRLRKVKGCPEPSRHASYRRIGG